MLITRCHLVRWTEPNEILSNAAVLIRDGKIVEFGPSKELETKYPGEEKLDANGQWLMPGNICAHTHFYGAYARGMSVYGTPPADFPQILQKLWWGLDKALSEEDVYYSALVCLIDAIRHGTTTLIDHHASPNAIDGSLDQIARAVDESGVRASLCYEVTDRDGISRRDAGIRENVRFLERIGKGDNLNGRLSGMFGLHASLTLSDDTLRKARESVADSTGFHIHVAEHSVDEYDSLQKSGLRVVDRLKKFGILGPNSIAVHAVHVDAREIFELAQSQTWVTHQPRSNMNNGVGTAQVESMMRAGIRVCLGNDGHTNTMWQEWKFAYFLHKHANSDPRRMGADQVVQMGVYNNRALAGTLFSGKRLGIIDVGAEADLILVDYHPYTPVTEGNFPWHLIFGMQESMVTMTMVAGKVLMKDRKLLTLDEQAIAEAVQARVPDTWERYLKIMEQRG